MRKTASVLLRLGAIKSGEESSVRKEVAKAREEERSGKSL
jgi:hypothetical protein